MSDKKAPPSQPDKNDEVNFATRTSNPVFNDEAGQTLEEISQNIKTAQTQPPTVDLNDIPDELKGFFSTLNNE